VSLGFCVAMACASSQVMLWMIGDALGYVKML